MSKRAAQLTCALDTRHYDDEIIAMMDRAKNCLCCNTPLKYLPHKEKRRNRGYCSLKCYYDKPPKLAYAEKQWGMPAREMLVHLLNRHPVYVVAEMIGVGKPQLYKYIEKFGLQRRVRWE